MEVKYGIRFFTDFLLLCVATGSIFVIKKTRKPFERGIYCDDESIRYPYTEDETVSDTALISFCVIAIGLMCICEWWRVRNENVGKPIKLCGRELNRWFWAIYSTVGTFLFGCACSQLLTDIAKYSVGRLRPHFIDLCQPDWSKVDLKYDFIIYVDEDVVHRDLFSTATVPSTWFSSMDGFLLSVEFSYVDQLISHRIGYWSGYRLLCRPGCFCIKSSYFEFVKNFLCYKDHIVCITNPATSANNASCLIFLLEAVFTNSTSFAASEAVPQYSPLRRSAR
ncbi:unnamed protein product, partial [Meganyctiphanes norvegica]